MIVQFRDADTGILAGLRGQLGALVEEANAAGPCSATMEVQSESAPAVMELAEKYQVEMPIARDVYGVVSGKTDARGAYRGLIRVSAGAESDPG